MIVFLEHWSAFGKIGAAYRNLDNKSNQSGRKQSDSGVSPMGELGLAYNISRYWQVNTSYQSVHEVGGNSPSIGLFNNHSALLGLKYRFGLGKETSNEVIESQRPSQLIEPTTVVESKLKKESEEVENTNKVPLLLPTSVGIDSFAVSSSDLSKVQASKVDKIIQLMKQRQELQVIIVGHSDNEGSETLNKQLERKRACSVLNILKTHRLAVIE